MASNNAVFPSSLIMRKMACFFCNKNLINGAFCKRVSFHFGIIHCEAHSDEANRDVQAYMHTNKIIRLADALVHPKIKPLFDLLSDGVYIKRTNGVLDADWKVLDNPYDTPNLVQKLDGDWACTFYKNTDQGDLLKSVKLLSLAESPHLSPSQKECLTNALLAMDDGIYKETAEEQIGLHVVKNPAEFPGIQTIVVGENLVRVFTSA